jgi:hypothetical protein
MMRRKGWKKMKCKLDTSRGPESPSFMQEKPKLPESVYTINQLTADTFVDLGYIEPLNCNQTDF